MAACDLSFVLGGGVIDSVSLRGASVTISVFFVFVILGRSVYE